MNAVSHAMGVHTELLQSQLDNNGIVTVTSSTVVNQKIQLPMKLCKQHKLDHDRPSNAETDDFCEVCLSAPQAGVALMVPCGHARFCAARADTVASMSGMCPICLCRKRINLVMRLYSWDNQYK